MALEKVRAKSQLGLPLFLLVMTTVYVAATFQIRVQFNEGLVGPRFLPLVAALLMYVALGHIIWREWNSQDERQEGSPWQPFLIAAATAVYIGLFKPLGYELSTLVYVLALLHLFKFQAGRPVVQLLYAVAVTAVFYGLFALAFGIRLPTFPGLA